MGNRSLRLSEVLLQKKLWHRLLNRHGIEYNLIDSESIPDFRLILGYLGGRLDIICFCQDARKSNILDTFSKHHRDLFLSKIKRNSK